MNRAFLLVQAASAALLISSILVLAYRSGGRPRLFIASVAVLLLLAIAVLGFGSNSEGPAWLAVAALVPPVFAIASTVDITASRGATPWIQGVLGCCAGLIGYVAAAFAAYAIYTVL